MGALIGIDDHGFHRGDGVFEALRIVNRKPYLLEPHFRRMQRSASHIGIEMPLDLPALGKILQAGLAKWPSDSALLRLFLTRGPGGFSTNPKECLAPTFFCALMNFAAPGEERYKTGVRIGKSAIPVKRAWMATTKSLNYLPNVMMKKESVERGLDFTVSYDDNGILAESSTENIVVLTGNGELAHPPLTQVLRGCTMLRLFELVDEAKLLPTRREMPLTEKDVLEAEALFMVGTTLDVISVCEYEGKKFAVGPMGLKLRELIQADQLR
jgi:branched-chain amino acid aminotransferase